MKKNKFWMLYAQCSVNYEAICMKIAVFVLFLPLWFVPVFKLNDYVMFPLYTSVSVYY